jgi:hypothetical protein
LFSANAFEFVESLLKPVDWPQPAFNSGGHCALGFSQRELSIGNIVGWLENWQYRPWPVFTSSRIKNFGTKLNIKLKAKLKKIMNIFRTLP